MSLANITNLSICAIYVVLIIALYVVASERDELAQKLAQAQKDNSLCEMSIELQNAQIKAMELNATKAVAPALQRVRKIYLKDDTCETQLKTYKRLFDESF